MKYKDFSDQIWIPFKTSWQEMSRNRNMNQFQILWWWMPLKRFNQKIFNISSNAKMQLLMMSKISWMTDLSDSNIFRSSDAISTFFMWSWNQFFIHRSQQQLAGWIIKTLKAIIWTCLCQNFSQLMMRTN